MEKELWVQAEQESEARAMAIFYGICIKQVRCVVVSVGILQENKKKCGERKIKGLLQHC